MPFIIHASMPEKFALVTSPPTGPALPALFAPNPAASRRVLEFLTVNLRNPHTRKAYAKAAAEFAAWCETQGLRGLQEVQSAHVATYVEQLQRRLAPPSVKLQLSAIRVLFDWLAVGQVVPANPAAAVRGPKHAAKKGKTSVLSAEEVRALLDSIDASGRVGKRDRTLIAVMTFTFARVGAVVKMRMEDVYAQGRRTWVRLHEKGGKRHEMPCHHKLEAFLHDHLEALRAAAEAAGRPPDPKAWLFPTAERASGRLTGRPMGQADVYRMVWRRATAAGIRTKIGCHTFRATGITEYLRNGGTLEAAQQMANHESARSTGRYDRRLDQVSLNEVERNQVSLDEVERILI
jgi:site-specific recombinase XerD